MTFINIVIIYCMILITYIAGEVIIDIQYKSNIVIFNQLVIESYTYAKNVCGFELFSSDIDDQEKFLTEALSFLKYNYSYILKKINMYDDEKLCQVIVSKITVEKEEEK